VHSEKVSPQEIAPFTSFSGAEEERITKELVWVLRIQLRAKRKKRSGISSGESSYVIMSSWSIRDQSVSKNYGYT
jgi:hypothetical protein